MASVARVAVIGMTCGVAGSIMPAVAVIAMSVWVGHRDFAPLIAAAGELDAAAEKHQAEQRGHIDQLADKVADRQTKDKVTAALWRSDDSPDQHPNGSDQQHSEQPTL